MFLHGGVELLGKVIGNIGHPWFLLIGATHAGLVLACLFIVLLFGVLAVSFCGLWTVWCTLSVHSTDMKNNIMGQKWAWKWRLQVDSYSTHICALVGGAVLLPLPLLFLLLQLLDTLLQHVGPEVALKVRQLLGTGQPVLCCLLEDVLRDKERHRWVFVMSFMCLLTFSLF